MTDEIGPAVNAEDWERAERGALLFPSLVGELPYLDPRARHATAALALYGQPFGVTHDMLDGLEALHELGCTCGVITAEDDARWSVAMREVPRLIAVLRALLPPSLPEPPARV